MNFALRNFLQKLNTNFLIGAARQRMYGPLYIDMRVSLNEQGSG